MILGTSAYKNGARATMFRAKIDAGLGYLKGEENVPQVVRTYYLNTEATERVARRARALREAAGTLSGVALGEDDGTPKRTCTATGNGGGHETEGPANPWAPYRARAASTVTSVAVTSTASCLTAGSTKRDTRTGTTTGTPKGTGQATRPGSATAWPLALAPMAAGHLDVHVTLKLVLVLIAVAAFWLLTLLLKPFGRCWACGGKGVRVQGRRVRKCWLCKGKGRRQRTGSRTVHRIRRTAVAGWRTRKDGA